MKPTQITIITVVYNGVKSLEDTILSVINQTYPNIEYIIQDGGSTDGTIDIIKKYKHRIYHWESTPDKGIYDAMNKSVLYASGEWINFMNSGDTFVNHTVIEDFLKKEIDDDIKFAYGNVRFIFGDKILAKNCSPNKLEDMPIFISHQATFIKKTYLQLHPYDISLKICADYKLIFDYHKMGGRIKYIPIEVSNYDIFGFSYFNLIKYQNEMEIITGKKSLTITIKAYFKYLIRSLFPNLFKSLYLKKLMNDPKIKEIKPITK